MNQENEKKLLEHLAELGFSGESLARQLNSKAGLNTSTFSISQDIEFGPGKVQYKLNFSPVKEEQGYILEGYTATLRKLLANENLVEGIDAVDLEKKMRQVNWDLYFNESERALRPLGEIALAGELIRSLWNAREVSTEGQLFFQQMQFRYWPERVWDKSIHNVPGTYEQTLSFDSRPEGLPHTNYVYHLLGGTLDDLETKLGALRLDQFEGIGYPPKLQTILSRDPDNFYLNFRANLNEGYAEFSIHVERTDDNYSFDKYTASITPYQPIEHGIYNGIDTKELEALMNTVNWRNDYELFVFTDDENPPEFTPRVAIIWQQNAVLKEDPTGSHIADQLQLKFWSGAAFFEDFIGASAWDYFVMLPSRSHSFPPEVDGKTAANLLCGRAAQTPLLEKGKLDELEWMKFDFSVKENDGYGWKRFECFHKDELEGLLRQIPFVNDYLYKVTGDLARGDRRPVMLRDGRVLVLQANPEKHTIDVFTQEGKQIPINLHFDPDFKSSALQGPRQVLEINRKALPAPKPNKKNRGPGMR
ncbi:hypothetical protein [Dinghuibacter silviterrae]|uniref:Uncharacterized protein n=1 Tax=Dinghuibacter silviterrae TaxID=1539049 RepID=A0A4R8DQM8_9BACT|nr:hypothetical protein [Dinghuibacter silviterrae]TDX00460.1 hypothetical protein EDB95_1485 [Dinghuibacter silviterrae]